MEVQFDLPATFVASYKITIKYKSGEEELAVINKIADLVSKIYASFLTEKGHATRSKEVAFLAPPNEFAPAEGVSRFESNLRNRIIKNLTKQNEDESGIDFVTHYYPETTLKEILTLSDIDNRYPLRKFFPINSNLSIINSFQEIKIDMTCAEPIL